MARSMLVAGACALAFFGCLARDVSTEPPTTKIAFESVVPQPAIDKVDLLVVVDDSSSMADKQRILANAVPDLVRGLVRPRCVDPATRKPTGILADPLAGEGAECPAGSEPAFSPVTDLHVGALSTSLGDFGTGACAKKGVSPDDRAHLRGFLAFYPDVARNRNKARHPAPPVAAIGDVDGLVEAFQKLVVGIGQNGCGFEAQLESAYRFLVQPDPPAALTKDADGRARWTGIDTELLAQRAAFLRPDSLVAVIVLSDEDDGLVDPLSYGGRGYQVLVPGLLPRGTSACEPSPGAPECMSCSSDCAGDAMCTARLAADPACRTGGGRLVPTEDTPNLRLYRPKQRYGVDARYPVRRYALGLTSPKVPSRAAEHAASGAYAGAGDCTNPLFAAKLPREPGDEVCTLARGPRSKDLVYFAVIGGVPPALVAGKELDWTAILGRDPDRFDETGMDRHMIPSVAPRKDLPPPTAADDADPAHGREYTAVDDLQYACTFPLYDVGPDGRAAPAPRACTDEAACDCPAGNDSPLCTGLDRRTQSRGKAYPTLRELQVARDLGDHGIAASLCPTQLGAPDRPDYGYRPAMQRILGRLETSLLATCLPRPLERVDQGGAVTCLVFATLPDPGPDTDCARYGLAPPGPDVLARYRERLVAEEGPAAGQLPVCEIPQTVVPRGASCRNDASQMGYCYVEGGAGLGCANALVFTKKTEELASARFTLQCIQVTGAR